MLNADADRSPTLPKRAAAFLRSPGIIAAIVSLAVSGGVAPTMTALWSRHNAALQAHEEATRRAVSAFVLEAQAFEPFVTNFVLDVSRNNKVDPTSYTRLADNVVSQQVALDALSLKVPSETREKIAKYEDALLALNSAMQKVHDVETMREFWERTSDLLVAREDLVRHLELTSA
jgi:hypothetical protein